MAAPPIDHSGPEVDHRDETDHICAIPDDVLAQTWGRLKSLMLKCPNHELSNEIIINNFYARLPCHNKEMLDASSLGSFTSKNLGAPQVCEAPGANFEPKY